MESSTNQQYCLRWNNHCTNLQSAFHELLQKQEFTDVLLVVEDGDGSTSIKCHKMVLAACSKFFQTLFSQAPSNEQYLMLLLPGVKGWEMEAILEYMYQGEVCVLQSRINDLLKVAKLLRIKGLIDDDIQDTHNFESPPPTINTTNYQTPIQRDLRNAPRSPTDSVSLPHNKNTPSPNPSPGAPHRRSNRWNHLCNLSIIAESMLNPLLDRTSANHFPSIHEASEIEQNEELGILRNVLAQSPTDSGQILSPQDDSLDLPATLNGHSAFTADTPPRRGTKRRSSQEHQQRKTAGKNYKLYSKEQMDEAIQKVERGECALGVAIALGIPSRTLYDKVKKMGIKTQRTGKRHRRCDNSAYSPQRTGRNRNGDIYRSTTDHDDASIALLNMAQGHGRPLSETSEASEPGLESIKKSPSSIIHEDAAPRSENSDASSNQEDEGVKGDKDVEDVQDLSVRRAQVIVSSAENHIKKEKEYSSQD